MVTATPFNQVVAPPAPAGPRACSGMPATLMTAGQKLTPNQSIKSPNGRFILIYQTDGNLVIYEGSVSASGARWATGKIGAPGYAWMQTDGNFVTYDSADRPTWSSQTSNRAGAWLALQDDGNLVVYLNCDRLWSRM